MPGLVAGWFGGRLSVADERLGGFDRRSGDPRMATNPE
jgi:hypothetical protein